MHRDVEEGGVYRLPRKSLKDRRSQSQRAEQNLQQRKCDPRQNKQVICSLVLVSGLPKIWRTMTAR